MRAFFRKAARNPYFVMGCVLVLTLLAFSVIGVFYTPHPPNKIDAGSISLPPSLTHPFGTDKLGRDILSRVMTAGRAAFEISICSVAISLSAGLVLGLFAGYFGGILDDVITKTSDVMRSIPGVLFALMVIAVIGKGFVNTVIAVCFITLPGFIRIIRSGAMRVKSNDYIRWATLAGVKKWRVAFIHILPNIISSIIVMCAMSMSNAVMIEASLSYLGLGVQPPSASWGQMLSEAQSNILTAPWEAVSVGFCLSFLVLGFNLLGDGLRDVLDVRTIK